MAGAHEVFIRVGENVVHSISAHESRRAEWNLQFVARAVIIAQCLCSSFWDTDCEQRCHFGRVEVVECRVDVPAAEAGMSQVVRLGDWVLVECLVVGMLELDVLESFVFG